MTSEQKSKIDNFKLRMPSLEGVMKFWNPTSCHTCYWSRISLLLIFSAFAYKQMIVLAIIISLFVVVYYGLIGTNGSDGNKYSLGTLVDKGFKIDKIYTNNDEFSPCEKGVRFSDKEGVICCKFCTTGSELSFEGGKCKELREHCVDINKITKVEITRSSD